MAVVNRTWADQLVSGLVYATHQAYCNCIFMPNEGGPHKMSGRDDCFPTKVTGCVLLPQPVCKIHTWVTRGVYMPQPYCHLYHRPSAPLLFSNNAKTSAQSIYILKIHNFIWLRGRCCALFACGAGSWDQQPAVGRPYIRGRAMFYYDTAPIKAQLKAALYQSLID